MRKINRVAMAATYADAKPEIDRLVSAFARRHGGDADELASEATQHFVRAYVSYNGSIPFVEWLKPLVWRGLLGEARLLARRADRLRRVNAELDCLKDKEEFDLACFLSEISEDARTMARLVVSPPPDVRLAVHASRRPNDPTTWRNAVTQYLKDIGWSTTQILKSFTEIAEALTQ